MDDRTAKAGANRPAACPDAVRNQIFNFLFHLFFFTFTFTFFTFTFTFTFLFFFYLFNCDANRAGSDGSR